MSSAVAKEPLVKIVLVDAVLAFARPDGRAWDGDGVVANEARIAQRLALVAAHPYSALLGVLAEHDAQPWGKPDPKGIVTLHGASCPRPALALPVQHDTYRPSWSPGIGWSGIPLARNVRLSVAVVDDDGEAGNDTGDAIGRVDITYAMLEAALATPGEVFHADVSEQQQGILYVGLVVAPDASPN